MSRSTLLLLLALAPLAPAAPATPLAEPLAQLLAQLLAVGPEGRGNPEATAAWKTLAAQATTEDLPSLLAALDQASPLAANWLRAAVFALADRAQAANQPLPPALFATFLKNPAHGPAGRLLAADLLQQTDPAAWDALVPSLLLDPVPALRREPVARLTAAATAAKNPDQLRQALDAARDEDQVRAATDELRSLGQSVDLPRHFGFLMDWHLIGPFDNKARNGFNTPFPPESSIDLAASYPGKEVKPGQDPTVRWIPFSSPSEFGIIDFNQPIGMFKEVTGYATTTFHSPTAQPAEIRLGCKNAWKLWLNGQPIFARDEYHRGMKIDQYRFPVSLQAGPNTLLVKLCQNEQTETWTVEWNFQLRLCDASGTALLDPQRPPTSPAALAGKK